MNTLTSEQANQPERDSDTSPIDALKSLPAPVHRDDDGKPLAVSLVLSPEQIAALGISDSTDTVQPVIWNGAIYIKPADN